MARIKAVTRFFIEYDEYGNKTDSKVGTQSLAGYIYNSNNGALISSTYGTGQKVGYTYDEYGNVATKKYNGATAFAWYADRGGNIIKEKDYNNKVEYDISYDSTGRLVRKTAEKTDGTSGLNNSWYTLEYSYDLNNNITRFANLTPLRNTISKYTYGKDNLLTKYEINSGKTVTYTYDGLNRLTGTSLSTTTPINTTYNYYDSNRGSGYTTTKLKSETIDGETYTYSYDTQGNITDIHSSVKGLMYSYEYDAMNQLVSVEDHKNSKMYMYTYDAGGNLIAENICDIGSNGAPINTQHKAYEYGDSNWKDKLTKYDGQEITYDAIGNPLTYRDGITMTWKNGRQLDTLTDGTNNVSYSYDSNSVRISKTVDGVKYTYEYINGMLLYETRGDAKFWYSYDANGTLYNVKYTLTDDSTTYSYFYTHNSRGDIVGIYSGSGVLTAHYEYDAWGNVIEVTDQNGNAITSSTHIGNLNPFRYRGYYYDTESGLYYLMSRYYDPVTHRFINCDGYFQSGGNILDGNMSAYCRNNPIMNSDPTGTKCSEHDPYYKPNCFFCNEEYLDYERKHVSRYNRINGTSYTGINDKGEYYTDSDSNLSSTVSGVSTALTYTRGSLYTTAGYYATSAGGAAGISSLGYAVTTPLNIVSHATNPYLTDWQKGVSIGEELLFAGIGIVGAALFVSCPIAGLLFGFGLTMFSYGVMEMQVNYWETENKAIWSGSYD